MNRYTTEVDPIIARKWVEPKRCVTDHNILCEICRKTFPNHAGAVLSCIYCNVICHVKCMSEFQKRLNVSKEWICFYCIDYLDESKQTHKSKQENNLSLAKFTNAQTVVAKYWRRYSARKFYVRIYNLIVYLQVRFRVNKRKESFHRQVQGKLRPFHLKITRCSNLNLDLSSKKGLAGKVRRDSTGNTSGGASSTENEQNYVYVVVTVLDMSKGHLSQTWRVTTDLVPVVAPSPVSVHHRNQHQHPQPQPAAGQAGSTAITASASLLNKEAVVKQQPGHASHHFYAHPNQPKHLYVDASFLLGGASGYQFVVLTVFQRGCYSRDLLLGQTYLDLSQGMLWKRGGSFSRSLEPQDFALKDHLGMDLKSDCRPKPQGSIDFELAPVQGLCACCGTIYAPSAEDLVRIVSLQPRFPGFTIPRPTGGTQERRKYGVGGGLGGAAGAASYGSGSTLHTKKGWVAIADGKIYMYSHFGDSLKVRINVEHFSFYAVVRNRCVVYILRSPDFPDLEFYTFSKEDELRWKCAFLSTYRGGRLSSLSPATIPEARDADNASTSGGSTNANTARTSVFDMRSLIRDLALVEVTRYNGRESALMHFYSPGSSTSGAQQPAPGVATVAGISSRYAQLAAGSKGSGKADGGGKAKQGQQGEVSKATDKKGAPASPTTRHRALASSVAPAVTAPAPAPPQPGGSGLSRPPAPPTLSTSVSTSSLASAASSITNDSSVSTPAPSRASTTRRTMTIAVAGAVAAAAAASASSKNAMKGLFDEIDREIAHIQEVKAGYKQAYREDRALQQQQCHPQLSFSQDSHHAQQKRVRHHHHHHPHHHRQQSPGRSLRAAASLLLSRRGTASEGGEGLSAPPTLQGIKEAVSEIYEVEEGALNETLNKVGASFVTKVLTALKQKKVPGEAERGTSSGAAQNGSGGGWSRDGR